LLPKWVTVVGHHGHENAIEEPSRSWAVPTIEGVISLPLARGRAPRESDPERADPRSQESGNAVKSVVDPELPSTAGVVATKQRSAESVRPSLLGSGHRIRRLNSPTLCCVRPSLTISATCAKRLAVRRSSRRCGCRSLTGRPRSHFRIGFTVPRGLGRERRLRRDAVCLCAPNR
jgi:hypothetical protein